MTTSRIARLAQAVGRPVPQVRAQPPATRRSAASPRPGHTSRGTPKRPVPRGPVSRSFDTGGEITVHAVVEGQARGADAVRHEVDGGWTGWTTLPTAAQPAAGQPMTAPTDLVAPPEAAGSAGGQDLGPVGSVGGVGTVPSAGQAGTAPAAADGDLEVMQMSAPPLAASDGGEDLQGWTVTEQPTLDDDEAFAQDISAILTHAKSVSTPQRRMPLPEVSQAPPAPLPAAPQNGIGVAAGHDVFEQMAAANTPDRFDQGPVSLSVDFARLDQAMSEASTPPPPPAAETATPATEAAPMVTATEPTPAASAPTTPPAPAPATAPPTAPTGFKVTTDVPLLPQQPGLSCHAAACASMVAWRDEIAPDPAAVASASGYWERYAAGRTAVYPEAFDVFGLEIVAVGEAPTAAKLRDLIDAHGPLFASGSPPGEHAVVIAGVSSDGAHEVVDVVDPWAIGMTTFASPNSGSAGARAYQDLVASLGAGPEHHLLLAHLRKGSS